MNVIQDLMLMTLMSNYDETYSGIIQHERIIVSYRDLCPIVTIQLKFSCFVVAASKLPAVQIEVSTNSWVSMDSGHLDSLKF